MNGDYIELAGPTTEAAVLETLVRLLEPAQVSTGEANFPLLTLDARNILYVDVDPGRTWPTMLAIGNLDNDDHARQATAKGIFHALECATDRPLRWTSDTGTDVITNTPTVGLLGLDQQSN